ncbi:MAG TPA: hypothetical protein VF067_00895 [Sphingomicrobium sp.]
MKRLIGSFAVLGLIAAPAVATTKTATNQTQVPAKAKPNKNAKKVAKVNKAAPHTSKTSN